MPLSSATPPPLLPQRAKVTGRLRAKTFPRNR
jgi:hypothetical protein